MVTLILRAAALAALTSAVGLGLASYRRSVARRRAEEDRAALAQWASDGGATLPPPAPPIAVSPQSVADNAVNRDTSYSPR